eukprot:GHRR01017744.1.p2 GENE.GHRR01017744.1~~GHRR01017744.1.p2  ORF type:complete len:159 (-),score=24.71 GHRR01017744.1:667-1143(-)
MAIVMAPFNTPTLPQLRPTRPPVSSPSVAAKRRPCRHAPAIQCEKATIQVVAVKFCTVRNILKSATYQPVNPYIKDCYAKAHCTDWTEAACGVQKQAHRVSTCLFSVLSPQCLCHAKVQATAHGCSKHVLNTLSNVHHQSSLRLIIMSHKQSALVADH